MSITSGRCPGIRRMCGGFVISLCLILMTGFALLSLTLTAHEGLAGPFEESIDFYANGLLEGIVMTGVALFALCLCHALLKRFARIHLSTVMMILWALLSASWIVAIQLHSEIDCWRIIDTAQHFAAGDYAPMTWGYTRGASYQLGMALFLEILLRLIPGVNIDLFMQLLNVLLSVCAAGVLSALAEELFGKAGLRPAVLLLCVGFLPFLFYNHYVYGTLPMLLLDATGFLCFVRYLRTRRSGFAAALAVSVALAYVCKPNALIALVALVLCALLDVLSTRDRTLLIAICLAVALSFGLNRLVIWQYVLRSGIPFEENVSLLTYLVMGISETEGIPGWYNGYAEYFFNMDISAEQQKAIVWADLCARLPQLLEDPAGTAGYFRVKILSQWLEPTYSVLRYGFRCDWSGHFNGLAAMAFREGNALNLLLEAYMNVYQQALYALACLGLVRAWKHRENPALLLLPLTVLGGFFYHTLFEAKSQYIYPYVMYLMPYAAEGLCMAGRWLWRLPAACHQVLHRA